MASKKKTLTMVLSDLVDQESGEGWQLTKEQKDELMQRYEEFLKDPDEGEEWEQVRVRIEQSIP